MDTSERFQEAVAAGDPDAIAALLAPDAVVRGPITMRQEFRGRAEIRELFAVMLAHVDDVEYVHDVGDDEVRMLALRGRRGSIRYEEAVELHLGADGLITEIRAYVRPLPGMVAMAAAFAPAIARARGQHARAVVLRLVLRPVAWVLIRGDAFGARMLRR